MPQLLLELLSEEIPARMQTRAGENLARLLDEALREAGLAFGDIEIVTGPRRLAAVIVDLPGASPDVSEERKGPRVGAPDRAIEGFLRGAGLDSLEQCETRSDKKGDYYVAVIDKPGRATPKILAEAIPEICRKFPWPKSMRWGDRSERWVRPLRRILCLYDGEVVPFSFAGVESGDLTEGHRVMGPGPFRVADYASYREALEGEGRIVLDRAARRARIDEGARTLCEAAGLSLIEDDGLLEENAGLAERPVPLLGEMDPDFLALPPEVIRLTMAKHQKYFVVEDPKTGGLAPNFVCVADLEPSDGGAAVAAGNARVLAARLEDARFFWDEDRKRTLADRVGDLDSVVFHRKLGSVKDKAERVAALARKLAPKVDADPDRAERAARLAKADLTTQMVIEFTNLQGVMGRYYALEDGEDAAVADAIRDHYRPQGPSDAVPSEPVSVAVALADKLDTLVGFWAIDEKPTGSKDPYALRRAALGVIRLQLENGLKLWLHGIVENHYDRIRTIPALDDAARSELAGDLDNFIADRLEVALRDQGLRHDHISAAYDAAVRHAPIILIVKRVEALQAFLATEEGENLLAVYKRATSILDKEEFVGGAVDLDLLDEPGEEALYEAIEPARRAVDQAIANEDFEAAMAAIAPLRSAIDAFFDHVTVNADDPALRTNRLRLLSQIRESLRAVADFDRIESRSERA